MNRAKTISFVLFASFVLIAAVSGCKKDTDSNNSNEDWAAGVAGVYVHDELVGGTSYHSITTFTVTRNADKSIVIQVDNPGAGSFVPAVHSCFDSITLNTSTAFNINETDNCDTLDYWTVAGSGNFMPSSLTIDWTAVRDAPPPYDSYHYNFVATR
jgi:hypothetical protein